MNMRIVEIERMIVEQVDRQIEHEIDRQIDIKGGGCHMLDNNYSDCIIME